MTIYAPLDYIKDWLKTNIATGVTLSADDMYLLQAARVVSRRIDNEFASMRPLFAPYKETRKPLVDGHSINSYLGTFTLPGFLLALDGATSINGTTVAAEVYPDADMPPFTLLRLTTDCASWYDAVCSGCGTPQRLSVPGIWGFHRDYAHAWMQVDTLAAAIVSSSATTFTVADADGGDAYGITPRISAGNLLKVDDEFMEVTLVNFTTNTVTVLRGANGTTAAAHLISAPVSRFEIEEPVKHAVARQVGLSYSRRGAYTTVEVQGMSEVRFPADWLTEVRGLIAGYAYA